MKIFDKENKRLYTQFSSVEWIPESGISEKELNACYDELMRNEAGLSRAMIKAKTFELIAAKSRIALDTDDIFQDKLFGGDLMLRQRYTWEKEVQNTYLLKEYTEISRADDAASYNGNSDYGHTSPNSRLLLQIGVTGLMKRIDEASKRENLSEKQKDFYAACKVTLNAIITFLHRMSEAIMPYDRENGIVLENIASGAPSNIYEAMQLIIAYFFLHEYVAGTRVRTLGRLDVMLAPFYENDIKNGTFTKEEIKEMLKFFLNKFWSAKVTYDLPFCLSGIDEDENEVVSEITYLIVQTYNELDIHSPKIHIRVSDKTPDDLVKLVLRCIRGGNSSFVFVNDNIAIKALMGVGITERDARDYVPIGCYEPAVWGKEIGCTGNGGVNLAKAVEYVITNGVDCISGEQLGVKTGKIESYADFVSAVKEQITFMTERSCNYIIEIEKHYDKINPDLILSSMYDESVWRGLDVYEGGALYNNSSIYFYFIATLVDSMAAVKRIVFDEKRVTFAQLCEILQNDWQGNEKLKAYARSIPEKYGNSNALADEITREMTDFCAALVNNKRNGRGGVFKASCFSIDYCFSKGKKTMATPDGRVTGEPLSKNLCATTAMDKNGITALINSVTKIDHSKFPNGSVLDIVLHPSAVSGEDGLCAFLGILKTYMSKGGFALHGNVFDASHLRAAQANPKKYANLQVRVCGWNAYFVNLSKDEQDAFIRQAENAE